MPSAMSPLVQRLMSVVAILAVLGIVVSSVSLQHHFGTSETKYCEFGQAFNCDVVNRSEYSSIFGIPVALIGMLGYGALVGLATMYRERRETPLLLFVGAVAGLGFALYLTYVEARILGVWCVLCLSSLAIITGITGVALVLWRKSERNL
jgi:vitamin-K-epoxide reductase (warfarin-sensitive)